MNRDLTLTDERIEEFESFCDETPPTEYVFILPWEGKQYVAAARERNDLAKENEWLKSAGYKQGQDIATGHMIETTELRANNAALREAIEINVQRYWDMERDDNPYSVLNRMTQELGEALASTPADSLTEYRDGILEEVDKRILTCCSVCSDGVVNGQDCPSCTVLRLTVRAMRTDQ